MEGKSGGHLVFRGRGQIWTSYLLLTPVIGRPLAETREADPVGFGLRGTWHGEEPSRLHPVVWGLEPHSLTRARVPGERRPL